ncbi:MAG: hypothetical protein OMM_08162 [Candidatus Magnetoglobus multicellularis str. Araruama]|uniref:Protein-glutamate O-methyltransferase n=1 Tax=Candidatus Magnetoglobus multicellularis str. Araruama TaxID=890399 RepID=A0A1V1P9L8_9BACT|nr:MAG: hypothetical protein OMM_08162 [Candidatus Magnetoglobus multicellularis str. Araruama]
MLTIENNFKQVIDFIARETGISLPAANHQMVRRFVSERLQTLKKDINTYLVYVRQNKEEYDLFLDAVTINETYFLEKKNSLR